MNLQSLSTSSLVVLGTVALLLGADSAAAGRFSTHGSFFGAKCAEDEFLKLSSQKCMKCDTNCAPGRCVINSGCTKCQAQHFTSREDMFWPLECRKCDIENCSMCKDNQFHFYGAKCVQCEEGYTMDFKNNTCVLKNDSEDESISTKRRSPDDVQTSRTFFNRSPDMVSTSRTFFRNDIDTSKSTFRRPGIEDDISVVGTTKRTAEDKKVSEAKVEEVQVPVSEGCSAGSILKEHDRTCMECDVNCPRQNCVDFEGCTECNSGYYRSRHDDFWPYECFLCISQVPNCRTCKGGHQVYHQLGTVCLECEPGYDLLDEGRRCAPIPG